MKTFQTKAKLSEYLELIRTLLPTFFKICCKIDLNCQVTLTNSLDPNDSKLKFFSTNRLRSTIKFLEKGHLDFKCINLENVNNIVRDTLLILYPSLCCKY